MSSDCQLIHSVPTLSLLELNSREPNPAKTSTEEAHFDSNQQGASDEQHATDPGSCNPLLSGMMCKSYWGPGVQGADQNKIPPE
jgi:hypothetical protein